MLSNRSNQPAHQETTCGLLLNELQIIWDEVGEPEDQRDAVLFEIEQKCLELYRKNVDDAKKMRAQLQQAIADSEAEIADICSAIGEQPLNFDRKSSESLKKELETTVSQLEEMRKLKTERKKQFLEVLCQLQNISSELYGCSVVNAYLDESDLSLKKLGELRRRLLEFQNEKDSRLKQVSDRLNTLQSLCLVLGVDFKHIIGGIHPYMVSSTRTKDVSDRTINNLTSEVQSLREVKIQRMQKLQSLAAAVLEIWNFMDTPLGAQQKFHNITSKIAASESEFYEPNMLSIDSISNVEAEVRRLELLKSTKMKDLILRKKIELEEICRSTHLIAGAPFPGEHSIELTESENVDPEYLLEQIDREIMQTKEEALCRKEILEKVEKWFAATQEESWLEEYNRDDNRYNAGRGTHLALKRAEKARAFVNKIPGMVEALTSKIAAWEKEKGVEFLYDGSRLLSLLEDYGNLRQEKENEKQRQRDQRRIQGQLTAEHETLFGSKPSPSKCGKTTPRCSTGLPCNRKVSMGGAMLQNLKTEKAATPLHSNNKGSFSNQTSSILRKQNGKETTKAAGLPVKKNSKTAEKKIGIQSPVTRKPLSPVSSSVLSEANIANFQEYNITLKNWVSRETQQITLSQVQIRTPSKPITVGDEENKTPKNMGIPLPSTPPTSVPMLTATTPNTPAVFSSYGVASKTAQPIEYSFEEVRAGFIHP
ncbi:hypothetical protein L6164_003723 [Bauhinia variegata]|uniref:Uncharacterized protein n=1 Tax=Bauhinia variegata TaxID=167791 RepID=A0ACB9Q1B5_BAUVA|nr:hypothetical protein L6164_003723 [Bauhinia variegata]